MIGTAFDAEIEPLRESLMVARGTIAELREACTKAQGALQRLGSIDDESRIEWALQALDAALASDPWRTTA